MSKKEEKKKEHNRIYQLYEFRDELIKAIENMKNVITQNGLLVESIINSKNKDALKDLVTSLLKDCEMYTKRIDEYTERLNIIKDFIEQYEKQDENSEVLVKTITKLIEALGLSVDPTNYPVNTIKA